MEPNTALRTEGAEPSGPDAPFSDLQASGKPCPQCGRVHPLGRFMAGCPGPRFRSGLYSRLLQDGQLSSAEELVALAKRQADMERDLGGAEVLSCAMRDTIRDIQRLELVGDHLFDRLTLIGPLTAKGKTRAALTAYLAVVDRLHRLRQMVGLERRPKPVDPLDAVRAAVAEANRT